MKTLFNVALLASLLAVSACGKKDEPVAGAETAAGDATAAAPATSMPDAPSPDAPLPEAAAEGESAPADDATTVTESTATNEGAGSTNASASPSAAPATPAAGDATAGAAGKTTAAVGATTLAAAATAAKPATVSGTAPTATASTTSPATVTMNGDPGTMVRAEILRARPAADAPEAGSLAAGAKVKVLARDGGWYQVNGDGRTGWVRMLSVRRSESATTSVAGIAGIASGRTGTGKVVTTTGVRGLDSGDLAAATFDEARIAKAETLRVSRADAEAFARQAGLAPQTVAALPVPAK